MTEERDHYQVDLYRPVEQNSIGNIFVLLFLTLIVLLGALEIFLFPE